MKDVNIDAPILVSTNDQYFIFSAQEVLPYAQFFAEALEDLFEVDSIDGKVIFEVLNDKSLPIIRVTNRMIFTGKKNYSEGELSGKAASFGMTYFIQKHLVSLFSNAEDFTNIPLLNGLVQSTLDIKNIIENKLDSSEVQSLYNFWD